uniref:Putative tick transposon n=1 Tax=Amblyomma aureolatum TaxID=187763 RepID=A0A1E1X2M4_9ACAR
MGSANRAVWRLLGLSSHRSSETVSSIPHPHLEGRLLHFMADPAHVIKNLRAQLLRVSCFYLSTDTVNQQGLPGNKVDIKDVEEVLQHDSDDDLKIANGLSAVHVSTGHFTEMKVSIAVQLFREAPAGIRYLIQKGKLPAEAEATAWFFELLWRWYSLMSSRHPVLALSKIDVAKYEEAIATLHLAQHTLRHVKMGTAHWKPSQAGLLISTSVVLSLAEELLCHRGYTYILTSRLSQDCLENIFSIVRMKKPTPSAYDVKCALKLVCVGQFLHTPKSTSYDTDDSLHLADLLGPTLRKQLVEFEDDEEQLGDLIIEEVSSTECDILAYFGGFLLKAVLKATGNCEPCRAVLVGEKESYNALINLKEYVKGAHNLIRPSNAVMGVLVHFEEHFKAFVTADTILDRKAPFRTISRFLAENVEVNLEGVCSCRKEKVERLLLEKYVRSRLRMHLRQQMARCVEAHSSKTCAGVNLS